MSLMEEWLETFQEVVTGPTEYLSQETRDDGFGYPLKFAAVSLILAAVLNAARIFVMGPQAGAALPVEGRAVAAAVTLVLAPILGIAFLMIGAGLVHIFVMLLGGERGYGQTLSAFEYASALSPITALASFVPVAGGIVSLVLGIYGIYIQVRGLESFQELSTGRALVAILAPAVIVAILLLLLGIVAGAMMASLLQGAAVQ